MCVMESILDNEVFASKYEISKKRKLIQEQKEETRGTVEKPSKRRKTSTTCISSCSQNGHTPSQQGTLFGWLAKAQSTVAAVKEHEESDTESVKLDCVVLSPSSSIDSQPSPVDEVPSSIPSQDTIEDSEEDDKVFMPIPMFNHLLRANDDLSRTQCKAPIIRVCHDEGTYVSNIALGPRSQATIPPLITQRKKSDFRRDMLRVGTRVWEPERVEDEVIEEFEQFCKQVVRDFLPFCYDMRLKDERYMQDKAFEILHDTNFNVMKAKEIVTQSPEFIIKKELCNSREAAKLQHGLNTYGRQFRFIRKNLLYDEAVSKEDMINYYYINKKRIDLKIRKKPVVYEEPDEEENRDDESEDSEDLSHIVHNNHISMEDFDVEHSLDLISPPSSPLVISPRHMYHHNNQVNFDPFGSEEEASVSCDDDFLIPIECSSGSDQKYDSDRSPVNFSTYESPSGNIKIDDLFALSNNL